MSTRIALFVVDLLEGGASFVLDIRARIMLRWCWDAYHHRNRGRTWMEAHRKHFPLEGNAHCYWCQQLGWDNVPTWMRVCAAGHVATDYDCPACQELYAQYMAEEEQDWRDAWAADHYPSSSYELGHTWTVTNCPFCKEEADARVEEDHRCSHSAENFFPDCEWCQEEANEYWERVGDPQYIERIPLLWEKVHPCHVQGGYVDVECPFCVGIDSTQYSVIENDDEYCVLESDRIAALIERDACDELHYELHSQESPFLACPICQDQGWVK